MKNESYTATEEEECSVVGRCENGGTTSGNMVAPAKLGGGMNDGREERMARYKEERRRQLAAQFGPREATAPSSPTSGNIRSTRASRLRTQANSESLKNNKEPPKEEESLNGDSSLQKKEKDKSQKRKSNLNKSNPTDSNSAQSAKLLSFGQKGKIKHSVGFTDVSENLFSSLGHGYLAELLEQNN